MSVQADYTDSGLRLKVRDYGIGIGAARLPYLFDRFYRIESEGQNNTERAGIGLSLVQELVKVMNGEIKVESELGRGSVFTLTLPTDAETWAGHPVQETPQVEISAPSLAQEALVLPSNEITSPTVGDDAPLLLIVDDNPDLRAYMRNIFEERYQVIEAADGLAGLERAYEEIPDLVVCDVMMPRLDGFGFCEKLKTDFRTDHIPVVMLTAKATRDDRLEGLKLGADDYLIKPFDRQELNVRVQNLLRQRELLRQKYRQQFDDPKAANSPVAVANANGQAGDQPEEASRPVADKFLLKATVLVQKRMADSSFSVDEFSQAMHVSRSQLHRKLKALTDQSASEFIRALRLQRAAELLKRGDATVSEVAYKVGFESLSYFSKSFQKAMGAPPSEWMG